MYGVPGKPVPMHQSLRFASAARFAAAFSRICCVGEHIQVNGQDVSGLELLQQLAVAVREQRTVRIRRLFGQCPVVLRILRFAQNIRDFRQQRACVAQRRRACPLNASLPLAHLRHVRRNPVAETQRAGHFPEITVLAEAEAAPEAAGVDVLLHRRIHPAQHVHIALRHILRPRHEDARIPHQATAIFGIVAGKP